MTRKRGPRHFGLMRLFVSVMFLALLINSAVSVVVVYLLVQAGVISGSRDAIGYIGDLSRVIALVSVPVALLVSVIVSKYALKPVRDLIDGMDRLGRGEFQTRVNVGAIMGRYPAFVEVCESFNNMAQQLESTELLRSDFINNFSHEFKTPIVSIAGFAKLLRRGNLPQSERLEYLRVIEEESMRLSAMATNVLNLTKVENQTILTDVTRFNLSEQMRSCILLLESKWERKRLELQLDFDEHMIWANEELLKQVWINLLDNAIKFAPEGHTVRVGISEDSQCVRVTVTNTGSTIDPEHFDKIFNKFYQADSSHATAGNGVGLAIVKEITQLHGGTVTVRSENSVTAFAVTLPTLQSEGGAAAH